MINSPYPHTVSSKNEYHNLLNNFIFSITSNEVKKIAKSEKNHVRNYKKCLNCKSILSKDLISTKNKNCYFCEALLEISKDQIQQLQSFEDSQGYRILTGKDKLNSQKNKTSVMIIICIDYSGSMNMAYIPEEHSEGKKFLKKKQIPEIYKEFISEYKEISRKELLLVNLKRQLSILMDSASNYDYQIFFITFSNEIVFYGNGSKKV